MSIVRFNTLQDAAGGNSMPVADINQGRLKTWWNLNGTGTIAARDSFNCSSFVDNGTGDYTANFAAFLNSGFASNLTTALPGGNAGSIGIHSVANSWVRQLTAYFTPSTTIADSTTVIGGCSGD
jgi:hypothetical protein